MGAGRVVFLGSSPEGRLRLREARGWSMATAQGGGRAGTGLGPAGIWGQRPGLPSPGGTLTAALWGSPLLCSLVPNPGGALLARSLQVLAQPHGLQSRAQGVSGQGARGEQLGPLSPAPLNRAVAIQRGPSTAQA